MPNLIDCCGWSSHIPYAKPTQAEKYLCSMEFHFCGPTNLTFVCDCVFSGPFVPCIAGSKLRSIKDNCGPDYLNEKKQKTVKQSSIAPFKEVKYPYNKKQIMF